jgi:hypothetical protein
VIINKLIKSIHENLKGVVPLLPEFLMKLSRISRTNALVKYGIIFAMAYVTFAPPLNAWNHQEIV